MEGVLDEYSADRVSVRRELKAGHNHAWTNVLSHYVSLLLSMLKHQYLHHSTISATATLETVSMAMDQVPDMMRSVGVGVVSHSEEGYRQTLQLLKLLFTWRPTQRVPLLLETALYMASHGNLQEAYYILQSQIHTEPFKCDVLVHGYSGVLQYLMWKKAWLEQEGGASEGGARSEKIRSYSKQALEHFMAAQELSSKPCHAIDVFILAHSQLLVELGRSEEALEVLVSHRERWPTRITSHQMVCDHVRQYCSADTLPQHLSKLVELDDSSSEAVHLAESLLQGDCVDYQLALDVLMRYLDYPHNTRDHHAHTLLCTAQQKIAAGAKKKKKQKQKVKLSK